MTSRLTARNSSGLFVRAACAKMRGRSSRPRTSMPMITPPPSRSVRPRSSHPPSAVIAGEMAPRRKMIGTIATSSNNNIASAALPTGLLVPDIGSTRAVEESANASPSPKAPAGFCPRRYRTDPMIKPDASNSAAPTPKTRRRSDQRRLNDNSSPIEKSSNMIPISANGSIASRSLIVTNCNQPYSP